MIGKFPSTYAPSSKVDYFYNRPGVSPGELSLAADAVPAALLVTDYNVQNISQHHLTNPDEAAQYLNDNSTSWIDLSGLGNKDTWQSLSKTFHLHPLLVEDVVNVPQRPKIEHYTDHLLMVCWMVTPEQSLSGFRKEQVSIILGKHYLITAQEEPNHDCFHGVRDRLDHGRGTIRQRGADYLAYALLDAIIDGFFPVLEYYGELIEALEDEVITNPSKQTLERIYRVRRDLLTLRRAIWPQRDAISKLMRDDSEWIGAEVEIYLRDCYDHAVQVMDMVETYRELATGLMDVYLSSVSNKMNEVMKLLTVISAIFIPLTFVAGVYGMNFNAEKSPFNMPELGWYWGYPACLLLMVVIASSLSFLFWRRGWFQRATP
jgi:magnesium transporter